MKGYIARDSDGTIWLYRSKPFKEGLYWVTNDVLELMCFLTEKEANDLLQGSVVEWSDTEPQEIELSITIKKNL